MSFQQTYRFINQCKIAVSKFQGGQLSKHLQNWKHLTSDQNILNMISGDSISFTDTPCTKHHAINPLSTDEIPLVNTEIKKLLKKGIIKTAFHENVEYVSPIFVTKKSDGGIRIILNLKQLNKTVEFQHFKMHTIKDVLQMITKGCYMTSIDLKDAYHSVKIDPQYQRYLKFNFENSLFQYVCYRNGLGPCPRRFTKITSGPMSVIRKQGHPICGYIDDFIFFFFFFLFI